MSWNRCKTHPLAATRGTSGTPRHTRLTRYRCSLPGLAGFAGNRCTEPEVPSIGSRAQIFSQDCVAKFITALLTVKASWNTTEGSEQFSILRGKKRMGFDAQWRELRPTSFVTASSNEAPQLRI